VPPPNPLQDETAAHGAGNKEDETFKMLDCDQPRAERWVQASEHAATIPHRRSKQNRPGSMAFAHAWPKSFVAFCRMICA